MIGYAVKDLGEKHGTKFHARQYPVPPSTPSELAEITHCPGGTVGLKPIKAIVLQPGVACAWLPVGTLYNHDGVNYRVAEGQIIEVVK
jgi:hypothetical protein